MLGVLYSALSNSKLRDVGSVGHVHVRHLGACCVVRQRLLQCAAMQAVMAVGCALGGESSTALSHGSKPSILPWNLGVVLLCVRMPHNHAPLLCCWAFGWAPTGHTCHRNGGWCVLLPWHNPAVSVTGPAGQASLCLGQSTSCAGHAWSSGGAAQLSSQEGCCGVQGGCWRAAGSGTRQRHAMVTSACCSCIMW